MSPGNGWRGGDLAECESLMFLSLGLQLHSIHAVEFTQSLPPSLENTLCTYCDSGAFLRRPGAPSDGAANTFHASAESFCEGCPPRLCHFYGQVPF